MNISNSELQKSLEDQLTVFKERALLQDATIHHVKPHGALYNLIAVNREKASVVIAAIQHVFEAVKFICALSIKDRRSCCPKWFRNCL